MHQLCRNCILPENYAGIAFNEDGVCNLCMDYIPDEYSGEETLKAEIFNILKEKKNLEYDCIVGVSGGRDSTYLLWYIVNVLRIKPLAVFVDSGLIPDTTISNIKKTVKILGVDLIVRRHDFLKQSVSHFLNSWINYPEASTLITLCTGCRLGLTKIIDEEAEKYNVPIVFRGGTPFEKGFFKKNLISGNRNSNLSFILGYSIKAIRNPSLIANFNCLRIQIEEYLTVPWGFVSKNRKLKYKRIEPFKSHFKWEEKKIEGILKEKLNWERYPGLESSFRGDCDVGIIRQFLYDKMLGYNDKDDHLSWLIRDKQITRDEALIRIKKEKEVSVSILRQIFHQLNIDYSQFIYMLEKNTQRHHLT